MLAQYIILLFDTHSTTTTQRLELHYKTPHIPKNPQQVVGHNQFLTPTLFLSYIFLSWNKTYLTFRSTKTHNQIFDPKPLVKL
jgi:hypothetical protein